MLDAAFRAALAVLPCCTACATPVPPTIASSGQGAVAVTTGAFPARELSGIAWIGGSNFVSVGDNGVNDLWRLDVPVHPVTGQLGAAAVTGSLTVPGLAVDGEGVVYLPARGSVLVSDEASSSIREFSLADGSAVGTVAVPQVYRAPNLRSNFGLEALGARDGFVWTANEEALASDGSVSTTATGTLVRIQRFTPTFAPAGQWAYRTDPISALTPLVDVERSGVVEVLPIGPSAALVLERECGGALVPDFRSRIYHVDVAGADDVSQRASLAKGGFTPLAKTLLWQGDFPLANFEGMTLGPQLADGCAALILVSDDGGGANGQQLRLLSLRLCGVVACTPDLDGSGAVDGGDLSMLLGAWSALGSSADLDGDGIVGGGDLAILLGSWGTCG